MKEKILNILNQNINEYVSGENISKALNVSRVTVSNQIKKLRLDGVEIIASTKKGYCLTLNNDLLLAAEIKKELTPFYHTIDICSNIDSTNDELKRQSLHLHEGYVLISDHQSIGKGRNGRNFYSPKQSGIYMSIFLKPNLSVYQSLKLTACASVAIFDAIKKCYQLDSKIKWVNDIYLEDKKIAGILCEASIEMNTSQLEYMIVGIGINVHQTTFPKELNSIASSIESFTSITQPRNVLIKEVLNSFYNYYTHIDENTFLSAYKQNSYILFKDITVIEKDKSYPARVLNINEDAHLIIEKEDGSLATLHSGEVSIRKN